MINVYVGDLWEQLKGKGETGHRKGFKFQVSCFKLPGDMFFVEH